MDLCLLWHWRLHQRLLYWVSHCHAAIAWYTVATTSAAAAVRLGEHALLCIAAMAAAAEVFAQGMWLRRLVPDNDCLPQKQLSPQLDVR